MRSVLDEGLYWRFSLAVYRQTEVAPACLALQARIGLDVNVLLMTLLAARWHQRPILAPEIEQADALVSPWRRGVVAPLREIRSRLKHGPHPAPDARTDDLRNEIKVVELRAEQIQQQELAKWIDALATGSPTDPSIVQGDDCPLTAGRVVDLYVARTSLAGDMVDLYGWARTVAEAAANYRDALLPDPMAE